MIYSFWIPAKNQKTSPHKLGKLTQFVQCPQIFYFFILAPSAVFLIDQMEKKSQATSKNRVA